MELRTNLQEMLLRQEAQLADLRRVVTELESVDLAAENTRLQQQLAEIRAAYEQADKTARQLAGDNQQLRKELYGEAYHLRAGQIQQGRKQVGAMLQSERTRLAAQLVSYEKYVGSRLEDIRKQLREDHPSQPLEEQIAKIQEMSAAYVAGCRQAIDQGIDDLSAGAQAGFQAMEQQPVAPYQHPAQPVYQAGVPVPQRDVRAKNALEMNIGGKMANVIGMVFILLGVVFGLSYTYTILESDVLKGGLAYLLGAIFLLGGELLNRRHRSYFSLGLCAGGVSILFASTAVSYFSLHILPALGAVAICIVITTLALVLSIRYDSQFIAIFAVIGGYMPMSALENTGIMILSAMLYFLLLNLFTLLISVRKDWRPIRFLSISLHVVGTGFLLLLQNFGNIPGNILYVFTGFALYTAIVLVYPIVQSLPLRKSDTVLLGINTLFSCSYIFSLLNVNGYDAFNGALALTFALLFFVFGQLLRVFLEEDIGARGLFFASSAAFLALAVPLQFETSLFSMGWLLEGTALCVYGILSNRKWYLRCGTVIFGLSLFAFVFIDTVTGFFTPENLYIWRYGGVTLGGAMILGSLLYRYGSIEEWRSATGPRDPAYTAFGSYCAFACAALVNLWLYTLYFIHHLLTWVMPIVAPGYWITLLLCAATLGWGALVKAIPLLRSSETRALSTLLYGLGLLLTLVLNAQNHTAILISNGIRGFATGTLIVYNCLAVYVAYDLIKMLTRKQRDGKDVTRLLSYIFALVLMLQLLMVQARLDFNNMVISFVLIVSAFAAIVYGFIRRSAYLRRFGLTLSLLSITKLFFIDLYFLPKEQRIISYFVFGAIFIAISFVYQVFSRKLLADDEDAKDKTQES